MRKQKDTQKELRESAHKIWLAGLGALAVAGEEGKALFRTLVEKGEEFEERGKEQVGKVRGKVTDAKSNVGMLWERVQDSFDAQVAATLHRLGVPSRSEIATLTKRVEELTKTIERTKKATATPRSKPAAPRASQAKASAEAQ
jgi:poly(hydroxyalkanoate) granule-associated protein